MLVRVIAGGSDGNCIVVQSGGVTVLIEAGKRKTFIEKMLIQEGFDPTKIDAIFVSHAHQDHCQGIGIANKYSIPVYASEGSWKNVKHMGAVEEDLRHVLDAGDSVIIECEFTVKAFATHHDGHSTIGFTLETEDMFFDRKMSFCLDSGYVCDDMLTAMKGSDIYLIEANHEPNILNNHPDYSDYLRSRILSDIGHLSNQQAAEALAKLIEGKGERIMITHLSKRTNTVALAVAIIGDALSVKGFVKGKDYFLEVIG